MEKSHFRKVLIFVDFGMHFGGHFGSQIAPNRQCDSLCGSSEAKQEVQTGGLFFDGFWSRGTSFVLRRPGPLLIGDNTALHQG